MNEVKVDTENGTLKAVASEEHEGWLEVWCENSLVAVLRNDEYDKMIVLDVYEDIYYDEPTQTIKYDQLSY